MMTLVAMSLLFGMVLGQRFEVLILMPSLALILMVAVGTGMAHAATPWAILVTAGLSIAGLQVGYLVGASMRFLLAVARASRLRTGSLAGALPARGAAH
jgi:hypothetical protein